MVWPATVTVAVRAAPVFEPTDTRTAPLPEPAAPETIVAHDALLLAVHAHPVADVTVKVNSSPAAATDVRPGATS